MSIAVEAPDGLFDADRTDAVLEWAARRLAVGNATAVYKHEGTWTVTSDLDNKTALMTPEDVATAILPADSEIPVGFNALLFGAGDGGITVNADAVTLLGANVKKSASQNEAIFVEKVGVDTWIVVGGTA